MKFTQKESKYVNVVVYLVSFCILLYLFWDMPLFSDDFEFADLARTKLLEEVIEYILYYGNGRLLGNTLAIVLVNAAAAISTFVKALVVLGIVILLPRALGIRSLKAYFVSFLLVLGVAPQIYAQVFMWTSGFTNFTVSVFLGLLCFYFVQTAHRQSAIHKSMFVIIGIISQLFTEHVTVINLIIAGGVFLHYMQKNIAKRDAALAWLVGDIIGAAVMLLIPIVFYVDGNRTQGYREIQIGSVQMLFWSITNSIQLMIVTMSRCTALFAVLSCFGWSTHRGSQGGQSCFARVVYITFPAISLLFNINGGTWIPSVIRYAVVYGGLIVYCIVLICDLLKIKDKSTKHILLALLLLAMISAAPFVIITPFGERCLFLAYIFLSLFSIKAVYYAAKQTQICVVESKWLVPVLAVLLSASLCAEMTNVRSLDAERNKYIETCMAERKQEICIYEFPSAYGFNTYLISRWYYYESWGDISFEVVEYDEWTP